MPTQTVPSVHHELRAISTANGGTAVTTTVGTIGLLPNTDYVSIHARNFTTGVGMQFAINAFLVVVKTQDAGATWTDYSENAQDNDAGTDVTLSSQDTLANGDALFVGSHLPFRGADIKVDATNSAGSNTVLTVWYWNGTIWTDTGDTDGTIASSKSLGQSGTVTWTVPSAWTSEHLLTILKNQADPFSGTPPVVVPNWSNAMYWTRWTWSAALDSSVTLDSMHMLNRSVAYSELAANQTFEMAANYGRGGFGSVELKMTTGTSNAIVNVGTNGNLFKS